MWELPVNSWLCVRLCMLMLWLFVAFRINFFSAMHMRFKSVFHSSVIQFTYLVEMTPYLIWQKWKHGHVTLCPKPLPLDPGWACACGERVMHAVMLNVCNEMCVCFSGESDALLFFIFILLLFHTLHTSSYPWQRFLWAWRLFLILYQILRRHSPCAVVQRKTSALVIRPDASSRTGDVCT